MKPITKRTFIDAFTQYDGVMPVAELRQRLQRILATFADNAGSTQAIAGLQGTAIRLAQALGDDEVTALVSQIIDASLAAERGVTYASTSE